MSTLTPAAFDGLSAAGADLRSRLAKICEGLPLQVTGEGSLFKVTATGRKIRNYRDAASSDKTWEATASLALLNEGFLLTSSLAGTVSTVTSPDEVEALLAAFERILSL
jgi:glutamate-1-semialdehyde aminotransferase